MTIEFRNPRPGEETALRALWKQAFDESEEFLDLFFETAYHPRRCRVADVGGIRGMLFWFDCECRGEKLAYLYAVATAGQWRNRGVCAGLLEDTHRHLKGLGYAGAILVPGEPEFFAYYEKRGYRTLSTVREFTAEAGTPGAARRIGPEEFAALRREFLPRGGVIQEGENLRLLSRLAEFYTGEGFLAAVGPVGEWLGDPGLAPGFLGWLGLDRAEFRTPGPGRDLCMGRWFREEPEHGEIYLGFAFD